MKIKETIKKILQKSDRYRNRQTMNPAGISRDRVNLEYWKHAKNLGDALSPLIVNWILGKKGLSLDTKINGIRHLYAVGSVIGMGGCFDATIWGAGIHTKEAIEKIYKEKKNRNYDIRAVRGPKTAEVMRNAGYNCPSVYGDPAVLMTNIYTPREKGIKYDYSLIHHYTKVSEKIENKNIQNINICTNDYKQFIDSIVSSKCVISSSLHGIILAEAYGIPAIFLNEGMDEELFKFYDWYSSTGREKVIITSSITEALSIEPMDIPNLTDMKNALLQAFPYDLWEKDEV